jgi:hypothetical protein
MSINDQFQKKNKYQQSFNNIQRILVVADFLNLNFDRNLNLHCNVYTLKDHFISVLITIVARGQLLQKSGKKIMTARSTLCRDLNVAAGVAAIWQHEGGKLNDRIRGGCIICRSPICTLFINKQHLLPVHF